MEAAFFSGGVWVPSGQHGLDGLVNATLGSLERGKRSFRWGEFVANMLPFWFSSGFLSPWGKQSGASNGIDGQLLADGR